jgi:hypothetical protein
MNLAKDRGCEQDVVHMRINVQVKQIVRNFVTRITTIRVCSYSVKLGRKAIIITL